MLVWDNSKRQDLSVYGRYAMIAEARNDLILTQDDDCVVSDPQAIVDTLRYGIECAEHGPREHVEVPLEPGGEPRPGWICRACQEAGKWSRVYPDALVCNMPQEFRHDFYTEHALVGFGACFHRDAPARAFQRFFGIGNPPNPMDLFNRTCDIVFTALTPRVLLDLPYENLPWATDESRMYRQDEHVGERKRMLDLVVRVGGAS